MNTFWRRKVHPSWLIAIVAVGVLLGVVVSLLLPKTLFAGPEWLVLAISLLPVIFISRIRVIIVFAVGCGLLIGMWRGSLQRVELGGYDRYINKTVIVKGKIAEDVSQASNGLSKFKVGNIKIDGESLPAQIWVSSVSKHEVKRSDVTTLQGKLKSGFGTFPGTMTYARIVKAERPQLADPARDARDVFSDGVRQEIKEPESSLGVGFLTGQQSALTPDFEEQLRIVGLTHIVVASGYNLTILVRFSRRLLEKISKFMATATAGFMIAGFMLVTGFSPSMSRAGLVAGLSLAAWYYGRAIHPLVLLPFAAAVTLLISPMYIWGDLGWYLSFLAFAGVILLAPLIHDFFWGKKRSGVIRQLVIDTISAQIITLPLSISISGELSPYALLANLLVVPFIPLAMVLVFICGLMTLIMPIIAGVVAWPAGLLLGYMVMVIEQVAGMPGSQLEVESSLGVMIVGYVTIVVLVCFLWWRTKHSFRKDTIV